MNCFTFAPFRTLSTKHTSHFWAMEKCAELLLGGKCGSTMIDRNLHKLMTTRYADAWLDVAQERRCPGSRFMDNFETHKQNFGSTTDGQDMTLQLRLRNLEERDPRCIQYDPEEAEVTLTRFVAHE